MILKFFLNKQFLLYIVFGGIAAIVNLLCGYYFYTFTSIPYIVAIFFAASSGLLVNFFLNYFFNFKYKNRSIWEQLLTFSLVSVGGLFLTAGLSVLFLYLFDVAKVEFQYGFVSPKFVSQFIAVGLITFYSFVFHKIFSFNKGFIRQYVEKVNGRLI